MTDRLTPDAKAAIEAARAGGVATESRAGQYTCEEATPALRFVERDGKRILQQGWSITRFRH